MSASKSCPTCRHPIPADAPEGLCPHCLAGLAADPPAQGIDPSGYAPDGLPGELTRQYELLGTLGRGGMSVVYRARDRDLNRVVALKLISPGMVNQETIRRFRHEAEALGRLKHPGIARIYEYNTVETGLGPQPYFVLECITGAGDEPARTLTDYVEHQGLNTRARLELMERVADAVHHAHQKGVIHRDLKPANILIDESGQPKIVDFGVARLTDRDQWATTTRTDIGQLVGTLPYMSPEQVSGDPTELDTRSDVYALGVVAYQVLCGRLPYELHRSLLHEAVRIIQETEPTRLSTLDRALAGDIETIVLRSLAKEKERRYQSAAELANDIRRYLRDEPILAHLPSGWYQLGKFAKRHARGLAVAGAAGLAVFAALLVAAASFGWAIRDREARQAALRQEVARALDEVGHAYRRNALPEAWGALKGLEARLDSGACSPEQATQVRQWQQDLDMLSRLDEIHLDPDRIAISQSGRVITGAGTVTNMANQTSDAYRGAFHEYGLPVETLETGQAVEAIRRSPVRDRLVEALDQWAVNQWRGRGAELGRLVAIAGAVDPDPWRMRVRKALLDGDTETIIELAGHPDVGNLTQASAIMLATALDAAGDVQQNQDYLRAVQQAYPDNYWINFRLARLLFTLGRRQEGLGFARAALASRPGKWYSHTVAADNLHFLSEAADAAEAAYHYRTVIRMNPTHYWAHANLAYLQLRRAGVFGEPIDLVEMETLTREAVRLYPYGSDGRALLSWALVRQGKWGSLSDHFLHLTDISPEDPWPWFQGAAAHLYAGREEAYRACCGEMIRRFGQTDDRDVAERVAKTCLLAPHSLDDLAPAVRLAEQAVAGWETRASHNWGALVRALAAYRSGDVEDAATWLTRCRPTAGSVCAATALSLRAMTHQRLGDPTKARELLGDAESVLDAHALPGFLLNMGDWFDWLRADILFREAAESVGWPRIDPIGRQFPSPSDSETMDERRPAADGSASPARE